MNTRAEFWSAVDAELDLRRDPLASDGVRAWTLDHADDAAELAGLLASLELVSRTPLSLRRPRKRRAALVAACATLLAVGIWAGTRTLTRIEPTLTPKLTAAEELERHPIVAAPELGSVQSWAVVTAFETSTETETVRARQGELTIENEFRRPLGNSGEVLAQATVLESHEEIWSPR